MFRDKTLAILGAGKLGEIIIRVLLETGVVDRRQVIATARHRETIEARVGTYGIRGTLDNRAAAREADLILVCVKPHVMADVLSSLHGEVLPDQILISTAAGVSIRALEAGLGGEVPVVRAMPNTPCLLRSGMIALAAGSHAQTGHLEAARNLFGAMGRTLIVEERLMEAVTALSGSGPAFLYLVLEALVAGGVSVGLPRATASELAAQTMLGAARMALETREHPAKLRDAVATPAGCTIEGLLELESGGVRPALMKAVIQATRRVAQLSAGAGR
ncbi:MAG: pyrroline-5-carboxylate reductase [Planctomycetes bacterium]|nr:pyrroline-5-carboxylate reductase [Planctomycetota bacterium]